MFFTSYMKYVSLISVLKGRAVDSLDLFSSDLEMYCRFKQKEYTYLDTHRSEKFVFLHERDFLYSLVERGCVGLVDYNPVHKYGIPVSRIRLN